MCVVEDVGIDDFDLLCSPLDPTVDGELALFPAGCSTLVPSFVDWDNS